MKYGPDFFYKDAKQRIEENSVKIPYCGCWIWGMQSDRCGYGKMSYGRSKRLAHRVSYAAFISDPKGMLVCHKCDTPSCVNPDHLFLGTHQDNTDDMVRKGRGRRTHGVTVND